MNTLLTKLVVLISTFIIKVLKSCLIMEDRNTLKHVEKIGGGK